MVSIKDFKKNFVSKMKGYSSYMKCGYTWEFVEGAYIPYETKLPNYPPGSMFPVCTECFNSISEEDILKYAKMLLDSWIKESGVSDELKDHREKLRSKYDEYLDNLKHNIHYMKERELDNYKLVRHTCY